MPWRKEVGTSRAHLCNVPYMGPYMVVQFTFSQAEVLPWTMLPSVVWEYRLGPTTCSYLKFQRKQTDGRKDQAIFLCSGDKMSRKLVVSDSHRKLHPCSQVDFHKARLPTAAALKVVPTSTAWWNGETVLQKTYCSQDTRHGVMKLSGSMHK